MTTDGKGSVKASQKHFAWRERKDARACFRVASKRPRVALRDEEPRGAQIEAGVFLVSTYAGEALPAATSLYFA